MKAMMNDGAGTGWDSLCDHKYCKRILMTPTQKTHVETNDPVKVGGRSDELNDDSVHRKSFCCSDAASTANDLRTWV